VTAGGRPRIDAATVRASLRGAGLAARHGLSQNFLIDPDVLDAIVELAEPTPGRRVLEIGPGLGILTGALLDAGAIVTAIEIDRGLSELLRDRFAAPIADGRLTLIEDNALDLDLAGTVERPHDIVANLPYHITSPILHRLLGAPARPERLVLMLQREVAERITAAPGGLSYLAVFVQYHAAARLAVRVPSTAFEPAPKVDSAVVVLEPYPPGRWSPAPEVEDELWRLVQASFRERRKMLHNVLTRQLRVPPDQVLAALAAAGIAPDRRPQTVSVEEWLRLLAAMP
jgi:16S rRNA (adenine1518-N6/adenine1519-N6)-dimethyltransferase